MVKNDWKCMRAIELTQNQFAIVDNEDYEFLNQNKWYASYCPSTNGFYAKRAQYLGIFNGKQKMTSVRMHRVVMEGVIGRELKQKEFIDHINHDPLDNRRDNLRIATTRQNNQNRKDKFKKSSEYPGVCWSDSRHKWRASITLNKKHTHLGYFEDEREAAKAYEQACREEGEELICKAKSKVGVI
jgi:hypothetical protein